MSVQVSYHKQALLGIMLLLVVFVITESLSRLYEINQIQTGGCNFINSDAARNFDIETRKQVCSDSFFLKYYEEPFPHQVPNQHFPTININSHGFRGPEITEQKQEDTFRIFVIGGSTAFGWGSTSDETTIPGFLQKKFDSTDLPIEVEVINGGIPRASSFEESKVIKEKLLNFNPDLFIVYSGLNELSKGPIKDNGTHVKYGNDPPKLILPLQDVPNKISILRDLGKNTTRTENNKGLQQEEDFVKEVSQVIQDNVRSIRVVNKLQTEFYSSIFDQPNAADNSKSESIMKYHQENTPLKVSLWKQRWKEICDLGKKEDFKVIVVIQPIAGSSNRPLSPHEKKFYIEENNEQRLIQLKSFVAELENLNDNCAGTLDLRNVFDGIAQPIYTDAGHVTDFGNEIVAQKFLNIALPVIKEQFSENLIPN